MKKLHLRCLSLCLKLRLAQTSAFLFLFGEPCLGKIFQMRQTWTVIDTVDITIVLRNPRHSNLTINCMWCTCLHDAEHYMRFHPHVAQDCTRASLIAAVDAGTFHSWQAASQAQPIGSPASHRLGSSLLQDPSTPPGQVPISNNGATDASHLDALGAGARLAATSVANPGLLASTARFRPAPRVASDKASAPSPKSPGASTPAILMSSLEEFPIPPPPVLVPYSISARYGMAWQCKLDWVALDLSSMTVMSQVYFVLCLHSPVLEGRMYVKFPRQPCASMRKCACSFRLS